MSDLTEFVLARLAEDEQHAATGERFQSWNRSWDHAAVRDIAADGVRVGTISTEYDEHVARWDPARVLAECTAKRRIVAEHPHIFTEGDGRLIPDAWECQRCGRPFWWCPTLRALALPYAAHPDYQPEWALPEETP